MQYPVSRRRGFSFQEPHPRHPTPPPDSLPLPPSLHPCRKGLAAEDRPARTGRGADQTEPPAPENHRRGYGCSRWPPRHSGAGGRAGAHPEAHPKGQRLYRPGYPGRAFGLSSIERSVKRSVMLPALPALRSYPAMPGWCLLSIAPDRRILPALSPRPDGPTSVG